jgi:hypothetical protein
MTIAGRMDAFDLSEISLVDAGAQRPARAVIAKADADMDEVIKRPFSADERKRLAESGVAMESGAYPIEDRADLKNAVEGFGRARDPDATKAHIRARAKALGAEDLLPAAWKAAPEAKADPEAEDDENEVDKAIRAEIAKGAAIRKAAGERFEVNSGPKSAQHPIATPIDVGPFAPGANDSERRPINTRGPLGYDRPGHVADNVTGGQDDAEDDFALPVWRAGDDWLTRRTKAAAELEKRTGRIAAREGLTHEKAYDRLLRSRAGEVLVTAMR